MKKVIVLLLAAAMCSACGVLTSPVGTNQNIVQTMVELSDSNYRIIGDAYGEYTNTYIFGLGGLSKEALTSNATSEMYKNAHLSGSQAIINITVQENVQNILYLYIQRKVIVRGQIIEFR